MTGHAKKTEAVATNDHIARPLTSLKDPTAFGPPPKNVNYHGGAAVPNAITPDRRGIGAPLSHDELPGGPGMNEEPDDAWKPPVPYRANTTGLKTEGLLPPPKPTAVGGREIESPATRPKPQLPPRRNLPVIEPSSPPPPYTPGTSSSPPRQSYLNQSTSSRLAQRGILVPNLGIGASSSPPAQSQEDQTQPAPSIRGLQNRFGSLTTNSPTSSPQQSGGTSFAQKQAALSTASQLQKDPTKVSASDARAAVGTANNFRERHGEEVSQGWKTGQAMNKKYGLADKMQGYAGNAEAPASPNVSNRAEAEAGQLGRLTGQTNALTSVQGFKKAPPPPPPVRRPTDPMAARSPPPIPLGSKPR